MRSGTVSVVRITDQHAEQLLKHGYAIVPDFLAPDEVTAARANMLRYFPSAEELAATADQLREMVARFRLTERATARPTDHGRVTERPAVVGNGWERPRVVPVGRVV